MTLLDAIILGIVEGLTEFIPVSSTGHLLITSSLLGLTDDAINAYVIVIQLGAIMAVVIHYWDRIKQMFTGLNVAGSGGQRLVVNLGIAFMPAAVVGLAAEDFIENRLMSSDAWVAAALILGGVVMIVVERIMRPGERARIETLEQIKPLDALAVGIAQCFALWPGMSRSMSTIVGGQLRGMSNPVAADFSFILALPVLGAATTYKMVKDRERLLAMEDGATLVAVGLVVSFFVAWAAIAWFLRFVKTHGMTPFGIYRIVIGSIIGLALWRGWM